MTTMVCNSEPPHGCMKLIKRRSNKGPYAGIQKHQEADGGQGFPRGFPARETVNSAYTTARRSTTGSDTVQYD